MKKLLFGVIASAAMLCWVQASQGQTATFGKIEIGAGYGSHTMSAFQFLPEVVMYGTGTTTYPNGTSYVTKIQGYSNFSNDGIFDNITTKAIPFDITFRPMEYLGIRAGANLLRGSISYINDGTINETAIIEDTDMYGDYIDTQKRSGTEKYEMTATVSGFPFFVSVVPALKLNDRIMIQPEAGISIYNVTIKGDKGSYSSTEKITGSVIYATNPTENYTYVSPTYNTSLTGQWPEMKYSGVGAFWGVDVQVMITTNIAIKTQFRKGSANLKAKYTLEDIGTYEDYYWNGSTYVYSTVTNNNTQDVEKTYDVKTESYSLGVSFNF